MRSKLLLLSLLMLLTVATNYAQSSATQPGIAVQGIARDGNNTALASKNISFTFRLYYLDASSNEQKIYEKDENLMTDPFGVFSYVIDPTAANNSKFANYVAYLRIKNGSVIISDEKLNYVPYAISAISAVSAISANNGVPTGSIMPYLGTIAPDGWALCNGSVLPVTATMLIAMVGANAPDLRGMFLRGAGDDARNETETVGLKAVQGDSFKLHKHGKGDMRNTEDGNHNHNTSASSHRLISTEGYNTTTNTDVTPGEVNNINTYEIPLDGNHSHTISGSTSDAGGAETRPINYGVNYIIKL
jgi:microcystin-dependent protein